MKRILAAVDGSERASGVVDVAVTLAARHEAGIVLLRAIALPRLPRGVFAGSEDKVLEILELSAITELRALEERIPRELRHGVRVVVGDPRDVIDHAAEREDADLVVIGSHGYRGMDRLLGTNAAWIVNHAKRAVLVARAPERITGAHARR